jgi:AcrR family transcriptional regulator
MTAVAPNQATTPGSPVRKRIIVGARARFFTHGFRGVTMDDLAEELGMSKKTLYAHFPSKTALLEAVIADKFNGMGTELDRISHQSTNDFPASLRELLTHVQCQTEEVQPAFIRDLRREAPEIFRLVEERRREVIQTHFGRLLVKWRRAGFIRKDIPAWLVIEILLGATEAIMNPVKMTQLGLTLRTGFSAILTVVLQGVLTTKGKSKL